MPRAERSPQPVDLEQHTRDLLDALLKGDQPRVSEALDAAFRDGAPTVAVYEDMIAAAMRQIGEMWHSGEIAASHEHRATSIVMGELDRLRRTLPHRNMCPGTAVVAAVAGERHSLVARMAADLLYFAGWDVQFLGADLPPADVARMCEETHCRLAILSATLDLNFDSVAKSAAALKGLSNPPYVIAAGPAVEKARQASAMTADIDAVASSISHLSRIAGSLVVGEPMALEDLLGQLGRRVQALRLERGWSQQQLAKAASLDRTYLSSVEHGKQNISVSAMKRIGDALGVPMSTLIIGED